jgi:hypothetical protein
MGLRVIARLSAFPSCKRFSSVISYTLLHSVKFYRTGAVAHLTRTILHGYSATRNTASRHLHKLRGKQGARGSVVG